MPIKIPRALPAASTLVNENIFVMDETRATAQDIRPLKIAILNLMPTKVVTETQLLRLLSNTPLQIDITLLAMGSHVSHNTSAEHLKAFYQEPAEVMQHKFDGMIITGAPVEYMPFADVDYWDELCTVLEWTKRNVYSTLHICWAAFAGLYYHYGVSKHKLDKKLSGIYTHTTREPSNPLVRGFDETFSAPHSRYSGVLADEIKMHPELHILADSAEAGPYIIASEDGRQVFVTGHCEYDRDTLQKEYLRDIGRGIDIDIPCNYFPDDDINKTPLNVWKAHANLLYSNWLNYFVYQQTPYNPEDIPLR